MRRRRHFVTSATLATVAVVATHHSPQVSPAADAHAPPTTTNAASQQPLSEPSDPPKELEHLRADNARITLELRNCKQQLAVAHAARDALSQELERVISELRELRRELLPGPPTTFTVRRSAHDVLVQIDRGSCHDITEGAIVRLGQATIRITEVDCKTSVGVVLRLHSDESVNQIYDRLSRPR